VTIRKQFSSPGLPRGFHPLSSCLPSDLSCSSLARSTFDSEYLGGYELEHRLNVASVGPAHPRAGHAEGEPVRLPRRRCRLEPLLRNDPRSPARLFGARHHRLLRATQLPPLHRTRRSAAAAWALR